MIRRASVADALPLLVLMRKLAEFEGYADRFAVTESDLIICELQSPCWASQTQPNLHDRSVVI